MPVHRHGHKESSSVYGFRSELEDWWLSRDGRDVSEPEEAALPPLRQGPADISPNDLYVMAKAEWNARTLNGIRRSAALAGQATMIEPGHGPSHAMMALAKVVLATYNAEPAARLMEQAKQAAFHAIEIDEELEDAHTALGLIYLAGDWSWHDSEQACRRALEINPRNATARSWLGLVRLTQGNFERALVDVRRAEQLEPDSLIIKTHVGWFLYHMRRYSEALDQLEKVMAIDPRYWRAYLNASWCYMAVGRNGDALRSSEMALALNDYTVLGAVIARVHAATGRDQKARAMLADAETSGRYYSPYYLSHAWALKS
jgi:Tfp pilus assembly protein PilF